MTYRVGIVGSGFGGAVHAPAYSLHPQFEVVAIASPTRAADTARQRNIPHAFASVEAMLAALGSEIDVVSVASPPFDHHRSVMAALEAGKHVLCEKPFALTVAQAQEMTAAANEAGVATALAFEFRYESAEAALKELVVNGHLPRLREIEVTRFARELRAEALRPRSAWWFDRARGGGVANSVMPHLIDLALWLAGAEPQRMQGFLRTANPQRNDDAGPFTSTVADGAFALLEFAGGAMARISADSTLALDQTTIGLHAEDRTAVASGTFLLDMSLYVVDADESNEFDLQASPYAKYAPVHPNVPPFLALLDAFKERIETGGGTCPTFADGLAVQRVLAAIGYEP